MKADRPALAKVETLTVCLLSLALLLAPDFALAQAVRCAAATPVAGSTGYQLRTDSARCEGMVTSLVSGNSRGLDLLSLTVGRIAYSPGADEKLYVRSVDASRSLRLAGRAIPSGTFYRLDVDLPPGATLGVRLNDVINKVQLLPHQLGLLGSYGGALTPVHVPLRVGTDDKAPLQRATGERFVAVFRTGQQSIGFRWRLLTAAAPTAPFQPVPNVQGSLSSGSTFPLELSAPAGASIAQLEVQWRDTSGDTQSFSAELALP